MAQGGSGTSTCTVTAIGGFTGTVNLTASATAGLTATLNPTSVTNSGSSTLTVTASSTATSGNVNVTGTSGSLSHATTVAVTISSATTPAPQISQATWNHRFSLSKYNNVQTFKLGAFNPSTVTEYISMRVVATDGTGVSGFTLSSPVIALAPGQRCTSECNVRIKMRGSITQAVTGNIEKARAGDRSEKLKSLSMEGHRQLALAGVK